MAVLIPMAGAGTRFKQAGYELPKPLIDVMGKPMIEWVVESLKPLERQSGTEEEYIFIVQKEHYQKYDIKNVLKSLKPICQIIQIDGLSDGSASTTLFAEKYVDPHGYLIMANSDQFFTLNESDDWFFRKQLTKYGGCTLLFPAQDIKWSYASIDRDKIIEVAAKNPISSLALCGIYGWGMSRDYFSSAKQMIRKNLRVNNEFYICPVYNEYIQNNPEWDFHIGYIEVKEMWGLGTPEDLEHFIQNYKG